MRETYTGWAVIGTHMDGQKYLCGRYCFDQTPTASLRGHKLCLFDTRREAREAIKGKWGKYRVKRATVTITTM